jgi:hypothetical protein
VSTVSHELALNIPRKQHAGPMNFCCTGCHTGVPREQKVAVYGADARVERKKRLLPQPQTGSLTALRRAPAMRNGLASWIGRHRQAWQPAPANARQWQ